MTTDDQALTAYRTLLSKHGRPPTNPELADALGLKGPTATARIQAAWKIRKRLVEKGLAEPSSRVATDGPKVEPVPRAVAPKATSVPAAAPRRASKDPIVASLIEKRDALLTKAKALDVAIEALSEAL